MRVVVLAKPHSLNCLEKRTSTCSSNAEEDAGANELASPMTKASKERAREHPESAQILSDAKVKLVGRSE